jgi:hypothetical protein
MLALGAVLTTGSGVMILLLALPPLAAGAWVIVAGRWARALGLAVSFGYAAAVGFVATTPLRGLTPPPGQGREPLDPTMVALTIAFLVAGLLVALGMPRTRPGDQGT